MVMAGAVLGAAEAADEDALRWADAQARLWRAARRCASVSAVRWESAAGEAFRSACEERTAEIGELAALAGEAVQAIRAHAAALRELAAVLPAASEWELPDLDPSSFWGPVGQGLPGGGP
ncbi:hypothetical protein [Brevibacterium album]|uniref:hypothetical protein n=1 Tax=Brevibacterium album TaxID=417948 RepID=UPI00041E61B4|nr:hypothetical protein [Brevibacterium album]